MPLRSTSGRCVSGGTHCTGTGEFVLGRRHPGPPLLRRLRSGRNGGVLVEIVSDEEPLVRDTWSHGLLEHKLLPVSSTSLKQGESLLASVSEDVLDAL